jgi:hypothetical protein
VATLILQYYAVTNGGADPTVMKRHLKQCSRHRDKYSVHSSTPKGKYDYCSFLIGNVRLVSSGVHVWLYDSFETIN